MLKKLIIKIENWFSSVQRDDRERYLSKSQDIFELERRIRQLEGNKF